MPHMLRGLESLGRAEDPVLLARVPQDLSRLIREISDSKGTGTSLPDLPEGELRL